MAAAADDGGVDADVLAAIADHNFGGTVVVAATKSAGACCLTVGIAGATAGSADAPGIAVAGTGCDVLLPEKLAACERAPNPAGLSAGVLLIAGAGDSICGPCATAAGTSNTSAGLAAAMIGTIEVPNENPGGVRDGGTTPEDSWAGACTVLWV